MTIKLRSGNGRVNLFASVSISLCQSKSIERGNVSREPSSAIRVQFLQGVTLPPDLKSSAKLDRPLTDSTVRWGEQDMRIKFSKSQVTTPEHRAPCCQDLLGVFCMWFGGSKCKSLSPAHL